MVIGPSRGLSVSVHIWVCRRRSYNLCITSSSNLDVTCLNLSSNRGHIYLGLNSNRGHICLSLNSNMGRIYLGHLSWVNKSLIMHLLSMNNLNNLLIYIISGLVVTFNRLTSGATGCAEELCSQLFPVRTDLSYFPLS